MFIDYTTLILKDYNQKKASGLLSIRLSQPSPAKLRDECLAMLEGHLRPSDEQILRTFFGSAIDKNGIEKNIKNFDIDKFKPLSNYLKRQNIDTDKKNVELLAWLLQFPNRPFKLGDKYEEAKELETLEITDKEEFDEQAEIEVEASQEPINEIVVEKEIKDSVWTDSYKWIQKKKKKGVVVVIIIVGVLMSFQLIRSKALDSSTNPLGFFSSSPNGENMYWDGTQYQLVAGKKLGDTPMYKLDTFKYNHLKRITTPDTITYNAKGYVWYIKINGDIEYYTSGGIHPIHVDRHLKPITDYMIKKYIHPL